MTILSLVLGGVMVRNPILKKMIQLIQCSLQAEQALPKKFTKKLKRREFLKTAGTVAAVFPFASLLTKSAFSNSEDPVAIIGGGTAGLVTAYQLMKAGIPCTVYEGSPRVGGRMFTQHRFNAEGMYCELGGELVDTDHTDLIDLCKEIGLKIQNLKTGDKKDIYFFGGQVYSEDQLLKGFEPLAKLVAQDIQTIFGNQPIGIPTYKNANQPAVVQIDQTSLAEYFYSKRNDVEQWVLELISVLYLCEYGRELDQQSTLNFLTLVSTDTTNGLKLLGDSDETYRIEGGSSTLPLTLAQKIESTVPIHMGHELVRIRDDGARFKLTFQRGGRYTTVSARRMVIAIPFSTLRHVAGIRTLELPPAMKESIFKMGYGTNSKLMMGFKNRDWRTALQNPSNGSILTVEQQQFWETSRGQVGQKGILTNFLGGEMGQGATSHKLKRNLSILEKIYPQISDSYDGNHSLFNWSESPWQKASYTCLKPGQYTSIQGLACEPYLSGRLIFSGEHTSLESSGFMNGAVESGKRAAAQIF